MMKPKVALSLFKAAASEFSNDKVPRMGAALSYYTIFSLAPLLVITIAVAGLVFGEEASRGEVSRSIQGLLGQNGAQAVQDMIQNAQKPATGIIASVLGLI